MNLETIITHDGVFHADEVFVCATMKIIQPSAAIIRTRDTGAISSGKENQDTMLIDVGMAYDCSNRLYDHHQSEGAGQRGNSIANSSFGLIWANYGHMLIETLHAELGEAQRNEVFRLVDDGIVSAVDIVDCNGLRVYKNTNAPIFTVSQVISGFNSLTGGFFLALDVAVSILQNEIKSAVNMVLKKSSLLLDMAYQACVPVLVISDFFPGWKSIVTGSTFQRVVFQDVSGTWRVQIVPETRPLPEAWRGLNGAELDVKTGLEGGIFCHSAGFIAGHMTFDGALKMAQISIR